MGNQSQSLALLAIRKAVELEPDIKKIPEYLELQGNIELSVGKHDHAVQSFLKAAELLNENSSLIKHAKFRELSERINASIEEAKNEKT